MPRHPITCVWPSGDSFGVTLQEAQEIVRDGLGEWDGSRIVRLQNIDRYGGKLSLRVGAPLAIAVQRNKPWAKVALELIQRQRPG